MLDLGYTIIKDLFELYRTGKDKEALRKHLLELARTEARFNLDLMDVILRALDGGQNKGLALASSCLRAEVPAIFSATGIPPNTIFEGEDEFGRDANQGPTFSAPEGDDIPQPFLECLSNQDPLYLYSFIYRKIEILRSLGSADADLVNLINLKARGKNIKVALIEFLNRIDASTRN